MAGEDDEVKEVTVCGSIMVHISLDTTQVDPNKDSKLVKSTEPVTPADSNINLRRWKMMNEYEYTKIYILRFLRLLEGHSPWNYQR